MAKVYHLNELEDFYGSDDWKLVIDVTDIWNSYVNKKITLENFNKSYYDRLFEYKSDIDALGSDVWNDLNIILPKLNETNTGGISAIYDDIYDWADSNDIQIKTK